MGARLYGLIAASALVWPGVAAAKFAPPLGKVLNYTVVDVREEGNFSAARRIVFSKAEQGYVAEVTIVSNGAAADSPRVGSMANRALAVLTGKTIRYHLNDQGLVVEIEDQDALMKAVVDGLSAMAGKSSDARSAAGTQIAGMVAALKPDAQRTLLASLLSPAIAGVAEAEAKPGQRPIALPAGSSMGQQAELKGTETVARFNGDLISVESDVEGPAPGALAAGVPGSDVAARGTPMMRIVQKRVVDPATGLVFFNERRTERWLSTAPDERQTSRSTATLIADPSRVP